MALKDNDYLETGVSMRTHYGENGDFYLQIWWVDEAGLNQFKGIRIPMSGGGVPLEIKSAICNLHNAMEACGENEFPE